MCALLVVGATAACSAADGTSTADASAAPREVVTVAAATPSTPVDPKERIVGAYRSYTAAVGDALARGEVGPGVRDVASGQALRDLRARVRANREDGVATTGELTPSVAAADVAWDGAGSAQLTDCVLNGLAHVDAGDPGAVETDATGTRRPVEASLERVGGAWVVTKVEMPQDADAQNPQRDPPFLRGPMHDGPPSCAPPDIEREVLAGYRAFWEAFDRAFGFGRDGPANPDDPALAATSVDPQLSDSKRFFAEMRERNEGSRGEPDKRDPWVLAVTDFDSSAVVADCVTLGKSRTFDLDTGEAVGRNNEGQLDYEETELKKTSGSWKAADWSTQGSGLSKCESPDY
jgi:hypothetical protein